MYILKRNNGFMKIYPQKSRRGPIKAYRKECFIDIGGLKAHVGWDT